MLPLFQTALGVRDVLPLLPNINTPSQALISLYILGVVTRASTTHPIARD